jgi:hypothetical protein
MIQGVVGIAQLGESQRVRYIQPGTSNRGIPVSKVRDRSEIMVRLE